MSGASLHRFNDYEQTEKPTDGWTVAASVGTRVSDSTTNWIKRNPRCHRPRLSEPWSTSQRWLKIPFHQSTEHERLLAKVRCTIQDSKINFKEKRNKILYNRVSSLVINYRIRYNARLCLRGGRKTALSLSRALQRGGRWATRSCCNYGRRI